MLYARYEKGLYCACFVTTTQQTSICTKYIFGFHILPTGKRFFSSRGKLGPKKVQGKREQILGLNVTLFNCYLSTADMEKFGIKAILRRISIKSRKMSDFKNHFLSKIFF